MIGKVERSISLISGSSASAGSSGLAKSTLSRTFCIASSISISGLNSTWIIDSPSDEVERTSFKSVISLTFFSIGWVISVSMSPGETPKYEVETRMIGMVMLGFASRGREV